MIRPRKTLRRGEPTPEEKQAARIRCCERATAKGLCERYSDAVAITTQRRSVPPWPFAPRDFRQEKVHGWMES